MTQNEEWPPEIAERFMKCLREVDGNFEVADMKGLLTLIAERGKEYPSLLNLVTINEDALVRHFEETGEVPPGVKMIGTTQLSDKVTKVEIIHGPQPPRTKDRT